MQARRNEKNFGRGATNYEILSATMVDRGRKFFVSNRLKGLEKLNIAGGGLFKFPSSTGVY